MQQTAVIVGPQDHGRRMSLDDFEHAEVVPGYHYELGRGVIVVSEVPDPEHAARVYAALRQFVLYEASHPGRVREVHRGADCKLFIRDSDSERHPDVAVYVTPPPSRTSTAWHSWVPAVVVEIVSPDSADRDYCEKREDYLAFGVGEYWIIDPARGEMLVLRRVAERWVERTVRPPETYAPPTLPGLEFSIAPVLNAGR